MGLLTDLLPARFRAAEPDPADPRWWMPAGPGGLAASGILVTPETALKVSAFFQGVTIYAGTMGRLPLILYRRLENEGRERARDHGLYSLLHDQPNEWQTRQEWLEMGMAAVLLRGNFVNELLYERGQVTQILPYHPDRVFVELIPGTRRLRYTVFEADGTQRVLNANRVLHIRGLTLDGHVGVSVLTYARESLGLWLGMERYQSRFFAHGARPSGALEYPTKLDDEERVRLKSEITAAYAGDNAHRPMLLEGGVKWSQFSLTAEDAQLLESKDFQVRDVARWLNLPEHMLRTSKQPTYASIEQFGREFVDYSLAPWATRWEQAIGRDLVGDETLFAEFLFDALLRGRLIERFSAYKVATGGRAFMAVNEVRQRENLTPLGPEFDEVERSVQGARPREAVPEEGQAARALHAAARRLARRERRSVLEAAQRHGANAPAWEAWVVKFYEGFGRTIGEALGVSDDVVEHYTARHRADLLDAGALAVEQWQGDADLLALVEV